jgi:hypothetical protein
MASPVVVTRKEPFCNFLDRSLIYFQQAYVSVEEGEEKNAKKLIKSFFASMRERKFIKLYGTSGRGNRIETFSLLDSLI